MGFPGGCGHLSASRPAGDRRGKGDCPTWPDFGGLVQAQGLLSR